MPPQDQTDAASFLEPVNDQELSSAYAVKTSELGPQLKALDNASTNVKKKFLGQTSDGKKLAYFVYFSTREGEPILEQDIERWLCDNKRLKGNLQVRAKVAYRVRFLIRRKFQREGLASQILPREELLFRRWGASQVQVDAMDRGRWVWTRPDFGYQVEPFVFESLQQQYKDWQRARGYSTVADANNLSDFPDQFLLSDEVSSIALFKDLQNEPST